MQGTPAFPTICSHLQWSELDLRKTLAFRGKKKKTCDGSVYSLTLSWKLSLLVVPFTSKKGTSIDDALPSFFWFTGLFLNGFLRLKYCATSICIVFPDPSPSAN